MWLVGIVALCQISFLPGATLFRYLRVTGLNIIERLTGIFAAGLITNYLLASLFVALHIEYAVTWWILIAAEIVFLTLTWRRSPTRWTFNLERIAELKQLSFESALAGILLLAGAGIMLHLLYINWGTIYVGNDDVASWDRWATEWAAGKFPSDSSLYPQLIPANGSITYVLLGITDVKLFAKSLTPVYSLLPILLFLSLAVRRRDPSYLFGGAIYTWILFQYLGLAFLMYGYADVPLAFFGFLTFYCVYAIPGGPNRTAVMAGLIAAIGTLLTKQGGVYALAAMAAYAFLWKSRRRPQQPLFQKDPLTILALTTGAFCAIWYTIKLVRIFQGYENPHMLLLVETLHQGRTYLQRIPATWHMFITARLYTAEPVTIAIAALVVTSLFFKRTRPLTLYCLFPFLLAYTLFFSYEIRTASLGFPLVALVCGETLHDLLRRIRIRHGLLIAATLTGAIAIWAVTGQPGHNLLPQGVLQFLTNPWIAEVIEFYATPLLVLALLSFVIIFVIRINTGTLEIGRLIVIAAIVSVLFGVARYHWTDLVFSQVQLARTAIGDPAVNAKLYDTVREKHITSGIVTDYWFLRSLPDIKQLFRQTHCFAPCDMDGLRKSIVRYPDAGYILMADGNLAPATRQELDHPGDFTTLFLLDGVRMIQVNRGVHAP